MVPGTCVIADLANNGCRSCIFPNGAVCAWSEAVTVAIDLTSRAVHACRYTTIWTSGTGYHFPKLAGCTVRAAGRGVKVRIAHAANTLLTRSDATAGERAIWTSGTRCRWVIVFVSTARSA